MHNFFVFAAAVMLLMSIFLLARLFRVKALSEKFIVVLISGTNIILFLLFWGFIDGRADMYVDIALTYAVLGFVSSLILAKYFEARGEKHGN